MLGAIIGDIVGSIYEFNNIKTTEFPLFKSVSRFTDDSVFTIAVADCLMNKKPYTETLKEYSKKYPNRGYGSRFRNWAFSSNSLPYNSWGNGSAMRVSPVGWVFNNTKDIMEEAKKSAEITHNHPEGIKGAQATAMAIFLAREKESKSIIKSYIEKEFGYDLSRTLEQLRPIYKFNESCQETVPEAIIAFLESENFEDSIRKAVSLGGDSDTLACITGSIAEAFYQDIPEEMKKEGLSRLSPELQEITLKFLSLYVKY